MVFTPHLGLGGAALTVSSLLVLGGCAGTTIGAEVSASEAPSETSVVEAPASIAPMELPDEVYDGDFTSSGFPIAEIVSVTGKFESLAPSVLLPFSEFSSGTAWVYDENHVVTNWHVVDGMSDPVFMTTFDGRELQGTVIATEEFDDIAVLELSAPTDLPPLRMSGVAASPGDPVFYIGHPSSIGDWIIGVGSVSAVDSYSGFVFTSMPTSPGASGSPMFNLEGEVIALISGCMDAVDSRYRGDGSRVFSYIPPKPNCGGTETGRVVDFVERALASQ